MGPALFLRTAPTSIGLLLAWTTTSPAYITVPREPVSNKVALADCVVVGKITRLEPKPVRARLYPRAGGGFEFTVAEVEVKEVLAGPKKDKHVRLGFLAFQVKSGQYGPAPAVGMEGCFFAVKHPTEDFYLVPGGAFSPADGKAYAKDVALARRSIRVLEKPVESLQSAEAGTRLLAAYVLVLRDTYRPLRYWGSSVRAEPMDAERSKLIMLALAESAGAGPDPETGASAGVALSWLRHGPAQWPRNFPHERLDEPQGAAAVRRWLKDNAGSYRLQRLVPVKEKG